MSDSQMIMILLGETFRGLHGVWLHCLYHVILVISTMGLKGAF